MHKLVILGAVACSAAMFTLAVPAPLAAQEQDPPDVDQAYEQAMDAFAANDWAAAAVGFEDVARRTVNPGRLATATELAAQARRREAEAAAQQPTQGEELGAPPPPPPDGYGTTTEVPPPPQEPTAAGQRGLTEDEAEDARMEFIGSSVGLGLGLWGWATPLAFGAEDDKLIVGLYMVIGAGSFFVPFLLTQNTVVTPGTASLSTYLGLSGVGIGALAYGTVTAFDGRGEWWRGLSGSMALASLAGLAGGYAWADLTDMDDGKAHAIFTGMIFGTLWALGTEFLILGEDIFQDDTRVRMDMLGMLGGAGLGILGGLVMADNRTWTWGDVEVVQAAMFLGAYYGALPMILAEVDEPRAWAAAMMAGSVGGLVLGDFLVDGLDLSNGQGWLVDVGTYVGWLFGSGMGYLLSTDDAATSVKITAIMAALFATGGGALTYFLIDPELEGAAEVQPPVTTLLAPTIAMDSAGNLAPGLGLAGTF